MKYIGLDFPYNLFCKAELGQDKVIKNSYGTSCIEVEIILKPRLLMKILRWLTKNEKK